MITDKKIAEADEIEGIDDEDASLGEYPIDTLLIRNETRTVHDVLRRIHKGSFIMDPDFQRDFVWTEEMQSKLIESVLMRIPLPVFYLAEDEKGRMIVVDGLQRLSTFSRFVKNELSLKLPGQAELNRKIFSDLSPKLQNRVEDCNLILYVIDAKVPERAKLDIFERVNSGMPLTRQQMRNCLYMGPATRFLKAEAATELFKKVTGESLSPASMRDREMINRFCAFQLLPIDNYRGDMDDFLAQGLIKMNQLEPAEIDMLSSQLHTSLKNNFNLFGRHAFRKSYDNNGARSIINASLWDVMSTGLSKYSVELVNRYSDDIRKAFSDLMKNENFTRSITYGTNDMKMVLLRFDLANKMFKEIL